LCYVALCLFAAVFTVRIAGEIRVTPAEVAAVAAGQVKPAAPAAQTPAATAKPPAPGDFAGTDTCVLCHEAQGNSLKGTQHAQAKNPRTPMATQDVKAVTARERRTRKTRTPGRCGKSRR